MGYASAPLAIEPREHPAPQTFKFLGVAGGTIERSCYSPHYANTALNSRGVNGKRTEHQNGGGGPYL